MRGFDSGPGHHKPVVSTLFLHPRTPRLWLVLTKRMNGRVRCRLRAPAANFQSRWLHHNPHLFKTWRVFNVSHGILRQYETPLKKAVFVAASLNPSAFEKKIRFEPIPANLQCGV